MSQWTISHVLITEVNPIFAWDKSVYFLNMCAYYVTSDHLIYVIVNVCERVISPGHILSVNETCTLDQRNDLLSPKVVHIIQKPMTCSARVIPPRLFTLMLYINTSYSDY